MKQNINPNGCLLRMLKTYYQSTTDGDFTAFCLKWTKQGTVSHGVCTTQKTLDYHKSVKGCSLSDILETTVHQKYYIDPTKANNLSLDSEIS